MKRSIILFSTFVMFFSCSRTPVTGPAVLIGDINGDVGEINVISSPLSSFLDYVPVNLQDGHFEVTLDDVEGFIDLVTVLDDDVFGARINALDTVRMVFTARDNGHFDVVYDGANEEEGIIWADWYRTYGDIAQYNLRPDRDPGIPMEESLHLLSVNDSLFRAEYYGALSDYHIHRADLGRDFLKAVLMELKAYDEGSEIWENDEYVAIMKDLDPDDPFLQGSGLMARWSSYAMKDLGDDDISREIRFFKEYKGRIKSPKAKKYLAENISFTLRMEPGRFNDSTCTEYIDAVRGFCPDCQKIADDCRAAWTAYVNTRPGSDMPDMEMLSPEGTAVLLSSLFGKVIYIDMWATWCGPCVKETPYMAALAERMKKRDDILCISVSTDDTDEPWLKSLSKENPHWPQYRITSESMVDFGRKMNVSAIPRFIIVGKDGKIFDADAIRPSDEGIDMVLFEAAGQSHDK